MYKSICWILFGCSALLCAGQVFAAEIEGAEEALEEGLQEAESQANGNPFGRGPGKRLIGVTIQRLCDDEFMTDQRMDTLLGCFAYDQNNVDMANECVEEVYGQVTGAQDARMKMCNNMVRMIGMKDCMQEKLEEAGIDYQKVLAAQRKSLPCVMKVLQISPLVHSFKRKRI